MQISLAHTIDDVAENNIRIWNPTYGFAKSYREDFHESQLKYIVVLREYPNVIELRRL